MIHYIVQAFVFLGFIFIPALIVGIALWIDEGYK